MKKYFVLAISALALAFSSCDEYVAGGTVTEAMGGNWWVYYNTDSTTPANEDAYSYVDFITTYNTAADNDTDMFLQIPNAFPMSAQIRITVDLAAMTFSTSDYQEFSVETENYERVVDANDTDEDGDTTDFVEELVSVTTSVYNIKINDGAIKEDTFTSPTGYLVDQMSFTASCYVVATTVYEDGSANTVEGSSAEAEDIYFLGFRKTGWTNDELTISYKY